MLMNTNNQAITDVFRNRYLLKLIVNKIQSSGGETIELLGARLPLYIGSSYDALKHWSPQSNDKVFPPLRRRYLHLVQDLEWVIKNKYFGLLKDILTSHLKDVTVTPKLIELTQQCAGDPELMQFLLTNLSHQFREYFGSEKDVNTKDPPLPPVGLITGYLLGIVIHGDIQVWNAIINIINSIQNNNNNININTNATNNKSNESSIPSSSILHLLFRHTQIPETILESKNFTVDMIIKQCIISNKKEILVNIVETIGAKELGAFIDSMAESKHGSMLAVDLFDMDNSNTLVYLYQTLPIKTFSNLFGNPISAILATKDTTTITNYLSNCEIEQVTATNHITQYITYLFKPSPSSSSPSPSFQHISFILNHFAIFNQNESNKVSERMKQLVSPKEEAKGAGLLYCAELYLTMIKHDQHKRELMDQSQHTTTMRDSKQVKILFSICQYLVPALDKEGEEEEEEGKAERYTKRCEYLLDRVGFGFICKLGSLSLVKSSLSLLQSRSFGNQYINLLSNRLEVVEFCGDVICNHQKIAGLEFDIKYLLQALSLAYSRDQWDIIRYIVVMVLPCLDKSKTFIYVTPLLVHRASQLGHHDVVQILSVYVDNYSDFIIMEASNQQQQQQQQQQQTSTTETDPLIKEENQLIETVKNFLDVEGGGIPTDRVIRCWYQYYKDAISRQCYPLIEYLLTIDPMYRTTPPMIELDRPLAMSNFSFVKKLLQSPLNIPLVVALDSTWKIVGMYGTVEWVIQILQKYSPTKWNRSTNLTYIDQLVQGAKMNYKHGSQILKYINENDIIIVDIVHPKSIDYNVFGGNEITYL
ncbi:hypothetical protein DFA_11397 [Cavenderia fasciculata]|uniref:Uncharacterized protein n=1 Tax=Cavenderia fasciculata TaxID=261658 RepID=F4QCQ4_CACFS|nr:uncharacterized protein DFA_11397 [Cavenderia fasciculata]EGG13636.1 hypothetical protein DFA_11397 [Cavenderia fasciculata]|eukprot:XP_004350340.1 hypothetical protein DFA_11397 [Cavenderia fasciculata]